MKIWQVADPTPSYRQDDPIAAISWSSDGRRLAVNDQLWEMTGSPGRSHLKPMPSPVPADVFTFTASGSMYAAQENSPELSRQLRMGFQQPASTELPKQFEQPLPLWQLDLKSVAWSFRFRTTRGNFLF